MPTWAEVKTSARTKFKVAEENEDSFKLIFEYEGGRLQAVIVSRFESMGTEWCDFSSACCRAEELDPRAALIQNFELAVGSISLDGDVYVVRYTIALDSLKLEELALPLHVVASTADRIQRELSIRDAG